MKNVLLINQFQSDNYGDQLLSLVLSKKLSSQGYNVLNTGYAQSFPQSVSIPDERAHIIKRVIKRVFPTRLYFYARFYPRLNHCCDLLDWDLIDSVVIGGGQLLKSRSVFRYCFSYWINKSLKHGKRVYVYGIGIDDSLQKKEIRFYSRWLNKCTFINCRDTCSLSVIKDMHIKVPYTMSPDIAFLDKTSKTLEKKNYILAMPYNYRTAKESFGYSISKKRYYYQLLNSLLLYSSLDSESEIILTATTSADCLECISFSSFLNENNIKNTVIVPSSLDELKTIIQQANLVISGRMHALILAINSSVNCIPIMISEKINLFNETYIKNRDYESVRIEAEEGFLRLIQELNNEI